MDIEKVNKIQLMQQAANYIKFSKKHKHNPSQSSLDAKERRLYTWYQDFTLKEENSQKYPEIIEMLEKYHYNTTEDDKKPLKNIQDANIRAFIDWVKEHNSLPSYASKDAEEKRLAKWKYRLTSIAQGKTILDILKKELAIMNTKTVSDEVEEYISWCEENQRIPAGHGADTQKEKDLAKWFSLFKMKSQYKKYAKEAEKIENFLDEFEKNVLLKEILSENEEETSSEASSEN